MFKYFLYYIRLADNYFLKVETLQPLLIISIYVIGIVRELAQMTLNHASDYFAIQTCLLTLINKKTR